MPIRVKIIDDDQWNPDNDFYVEIYDIMTQTKMAGDDTETRVTILDDDKPGVLGFSERTIRVKRKDEKVSIKILRTEGADG